MLCVDSRLKKGLKYEHRTETQEFQKIEEFPIGEDEDILDLSDPPYYTARLNPFIDDFIKHYEKTISHLFQQVVAYSGECESTQDKSKPNIIAIKSFRLIGGFPAVWYTGSPTSDQRFRQIKFLWSIVNSHQIQKPRSEMGNNGISEK